MSDLYVVRFHKENAVPEASLAIIARTTLVFKVMRPEFRSISAITYDTKNVLLLNMYALETFKAIHTFFSAASTLPIYGLISLQLQLTFSSQLEAFLVFSCQSLFVGMLIFTSVYQPFSLRAH